MMRLITLPSSAMAFCGARMLVDVLTDSRWLWPMRRQNERSRIVRKSLDLCGIIATGDILRCVGMLSMISPSRTSLANPFSTVCRVCWMRYSRAAGSFAEMCAPRRIAAMISSLVHGSPQSTGQP